MVTNVHVASMLYYSTQLNYTLCYTQRRLVLVHAQLPTINQWPAFRDAKQHRCMSRSMTTQWDCMHAAVSNQAVGLLSYWPSRSLCLHTAEYLCLFKHKALQ